jgi:outer membrane protein
MARTLIFAAVAALAGCGVVRFEPDSEIAPSQSVDQSWSPPSSAGRRADAASSLEELRRVDESPEIRAQAPREYDLPTLIDLALRTNPLTQQAWYTARAANAALGQAQASNYPRIQADAVGGYFKLPIQFPGQTLIIRNSDFLPQFKVTYDLLDFGRTRAEERAAREQLIAGNFTFNRVIQDVVFEVEKAYYMVAAANASVSAAEANLKLARTSLDAVQERHHLGLATKPQVLLAKQVQAQAVYDLENAKSMVHDAEAGLRQAVGVAADADITVQGGQLEHLPENLSDDVEKLMTDAIKKRPDIAAQIAAVRAGDAAIARARAEYYPEVEVGGNYGQIIWNYTVNGGSTQNLNQPFYGIGATVRWDAFTGFSRYYGEQKATAERNAARSQLRSLELDVTAAVWTSYYDYLSAKKKVDASQALLDASQESYNANLESHRHGLATINDLIAAERDLMGARYTLVQSKTALLLSSSALVHAVGSASSATVSSNR